MSLPLVFQAEVREEIDEAYVWYEEQRHGLGEEFLTEVQLVLDRIEQDPEIHTPIYQTVRHGRLKRFAYGVYYRLEPERIVVIRRPPQQTRSEALAIQGLTSGCSGPAARAAEPGRWAS